MSSEPSEFEARHYYDGVSPEATGPKLIYRTSDDLFERPANPETASRLMSVIPVAEHDEMGRQGLWDFARDQVVALLDKGQIKITSVDLVRFTWVEEEKQSPALAQIYQEAHRQLLGESELRAYPQTIRGRHTSNATVWIGVLPDSLSSSTAHNSAKEILQFLQSVRLDSVDIAFREAVAERLCTPRPPLFPAAQDYVSQIDLKNPLAVPIGQGIAAREALKEGSLGLFFHAGSELYAITARHVLFDAQHTVQEYRDDDSGNQHEVVLMGSSYEAYLKSIRTRLEHHETSVLLNEKSLHAAQARLDAAPGTPGLQADLSKRREFLAAMQEKVALLADFLASVEKAWFTKQQRTIGFVKWAPSIALEVHPHQYTRDVCVVQLHKDMFKHLDGNVLRLGGPQTGPQTNIKDFNKVVDLGRDGPCGDKEFDYPLDGFLHVQGIVPSHAIGPTTTAEPQPARRVLKRGKATGLTWGNQSSYKSYVRYYDHLEPSSSIEMPILRHENASAGFSQGGDSGSAVLTPRGEICGLLTRGSLSVSDSADVTYATPFAWIWELVKQEFPEASLDFDNLEADFF